RVLRGGAAAPRRGGGRARPERRARRAAGRDGALDLPAARARALRRPLPRPDRCLGRGAAPRPIARRGLDSSRSRARGWGMTVAVGDEPVVGLEGFGGLVLKPGDAGYEEERRVHNGLIDKRPALIAQARGVADVVAAVNLARERGLELSIRGGGHNVSGKAVTEGGLMLDLSLMKGIHVDPAARTVRAQGGVLWGELNRETQLHGLAVTGGAISTTGIAGLTLGGGLGWLMPKHGLAADNLLSVELVTADGKVLHVSADEHPDLFWGLRGGGGNFGVATSFEYRLHPIGPIITGGLVAHPVEAAGDLLRFMRDFAEG